MSESKKSDAKPDAKSAEPTFEQSLTEVETAIRALEAGDIPLEDSIDLYAKAMGHLKRCHTILDRAEGRLEIVRKSVEGGVEAVPADFQDGEGVQPARPPRGRPVPEGPFTA
jgi:exodeoxyribonuclease VII small subunit